MLYITYIELYSENYEGIRKKILAQIKTFEREFGDVYYTCYAGHMFYLLKADKVVEKELAITREKCNRFISTWAEKYKIEKVYVRYAFSDKWFLGLLEQFKRKNKKIVLEIPTYPYDGEITNIRIKQEDGYFREQIKEYIDCVATNVDEKSVWGIPCVKLINGIDLDANPLRNKVKEKNRIVMIAVSTLMMWQGYERVLLGMHDFYKANTGFDFLFKIVGGGPEKENYQLLAKRYGLEHRAEFCGILEGDALNRQYDSADIAVSSLGRYKSGVQDFSPIKGAEYCARGIPFICGYHDIRFQGKENFILNVPNSPEAIDMGQVISFYENITSQAGYQKEMREYASKHLSWEVVMQPILSVLR